MHTFKVFTVYYHWNMWCHMCKWKVYPWRYLPIKFLIYLVVNCSTTPKQPFCDQTHGQCVECLSGSQCTDPKKKICDQTQGQCVECTSSVNSHCVTNQTCGATCVKGLCTAGGTDSHCVYLFSILVENCSSTYNRPLCDVSQGKCVECFSSLQCNDPKRSICQNNQCVECTILNNAHCRTDETCDATCVQGMCTPGGKFFLLHLFFWCFANSNNPSLQLFTN